MSGRRPCREAKSSVWPWRALIRKPRLLLDEPLGALDALTRIEMQQLIESLWHQHGFTVLLVTHDVSEAVAIADRVLSLPGAPLEPEPTSPLPTPLRWAN